MRNLPDDLKAHLKTGVTTICKCWKVTRKDGVSMGFTDHDRDLAFENVTFEASTGIDATALQTSSGLTVDNTEAIGALSSNGLLEEDLASGKFIDADVQIWIVNWEKPSDRYPIFYGSLGEVSFGKDSFTAELRGIAEQLNVPRGRRCLRQCTALLGDRSCKFDVTEPTFQFEVEISRVENKQFIYIRDAKDQTDGWFANGSMKFLTGKNSGTTVLIGNDRLANSERRLEIVGPLYFNPKAGDLIKIIAGCNKSAKQCKTKFNNIENFQGFPFIPGEDWALAYPKNPGSSG